MLHDCTEDKGTHEGNRETVGHGLVMLLEGILMHMQSQAPIEVEEEDAPHIVALLDDDGVFA